MAAGVPRGHAPLRNLDISWRGRVGIIATNTIAQGDTREVGLDQAVGNGVSVYRAVKSWRWPGTASLEVSLVWIGHAREDEPPSSLDGRQVVAITPSLDPRSRVTGNPHRLAANADQSFQGSNILGLGFTMTPGAAQELIARDQRNKDVLFPYLIGDDLNSRPDYSANRWVINFHNWPSSRPSSTRTVSGSSSKKSSPNAPRTMILGVAYLVAFLGHGFHDTRQRQLPL